MEENCYRRGRRRGRIRRRWVGDEIAMAERIRPSPEAGRHSAACAHCAELDDHYSCRHHAHRDPRCHGGGGTAGMDRSAPLARWLLQRVDLEVRLDRPVATRVRPALSPAPLDSLRPVAFQVHLRAFQVRLLVSLARPAALLARLVALLARLVASKVHPVGPVQVGRRRRLRRKGSSMTALTSPATSY
jgi:hypothetical protein